MRAKSFASLILSLALGFLLAQNALANANPKSLAVLAVSENPKESAPAITELRAMGQPGLDALFEVYGNEIKTRVADTSAGAQSRSWQRISAALDAVAQQKNSYASRLYWYTDFEKAKAAAKASGKPILFLRLLGNLSEEYSCANSRFFRTVLYANKTVSDALRERFILHWSSVRPAPKVTIDYGDGRKLERTLTGNSIHYILDSDGRVVDGLPGLYGPQAFLRGVVDAETFIKNNADKDPQARFMALLRYHKERVDSIGKLWAADAVKVGSSVPQSLLPQATGSQSFDARVAARTAITKSVSEVNIINAVAADVIVLKESTDLEAWVKIANLHEEDARLDKDSISLIRRQNSLELGSAPNEEQLSRIVGNFEKYLALDSVRNEYTMHSMLHAWLSSGMIDTEIERLNARIYKDLFLTPNSDPWLGLYSPDTYTALDNGGVSR